jgi:transposase
MTHRTSVIVDHHKSVFVCAVLDEETGELKHETLKARRAEVEPFLKSLDGPVRIFVEACRGWEWVSNLAGEIGADFKLVNPREMPEISKSMKKTDRKDVEKMLRRLQVEGELPESRCLSREERALRSITRERSDVSKSKRKLMVRIHAVIDSHDLPTVKAEFVKPEWRAQTKAALRPDEWIVLELQLSQYDHALGVIELLDQRMIGIASKLPFYELLNTVPGLGPVLASIILAEVGNIRDFKDARQFAAYVGLVPRVRSSAGKARCGPITKAGPSDLRWAITQAIVISARCKAQSAVTRMYHRKRAKGKPTRVAICAAANKLARVIHSMLTNETPFSYEAA